MPGEAARAGPHLMIGILNSQKKKPMNLRRLWYLNRWLVSQKIYLVDVYRFWNMLTYFVPNYMWISTNGHPPIDCFMWENPTNMDDLGLPLFQETSICQNDMKFYVISSPPVALWGEPWTTHHGGQQRHSSWAVFRGLLGWEVGKKNIDNYKQL